MRVQKILKENRRDLFQIYLYLALYQSLVLIEPFALGKAIDGLLSQEWIWLSVFLLLAIIANVFMYKRMVFDTIVYTRIYNNIVLKYLSNDKTENTSSRSARTDMANMVIHFFEDAIPYYIMSIISIVGSISFILVTDIKTGGIVILCLIPVILLVIQFYPRINKVTRLANTHYEKKVETLVENDDLKNHQFFQRRGKLQIYRSNLQGKSWFWLNNTKTLFLIFALVIFTHDRLNLTQGEAIAMYSYINQFLISILSIPVAMEIWSMVKDVTSRLNQE
jgi:ABC-type bacteriocin/lantibiotic exporter with double-glycine peptidase domain